MKKLFVLVVLLVTSLLLTACGSTVEQQPQKAQQTTQKAQPVKQELTFSQKQQQWFTYTESFLEPLKDCADNLLIYQKELVPALIRSCGYGEFAGGLWAPNPNTKLVVDNATKRFQADGNRLLEVTLYGYKPGMEDVRDALITLANVNKNVMGITMEQVKPGNMYVLGDLMKANITEWDIVLREFLDAAKKNDQLYGTRQDPK